MIATTECKSEIHTRTLPHVPLDRAAKSLEPKAAESCPLPKSKPRILLAEDHEDTRRVIEKFLSRAGFEVLATADLKGAVEVLSTGQFDIIISDIALPDGTGYALISEARRRGVRALAIALSAFTYPTEVFQSHVTGFDHHLRKPFDPAMLRLILTMERRDPPRPAGYPV